MVSSRVATLGFECDLVTEVVHEGKRPQLQELNEFVRMRADKDAADELVHERVDERLQTSRLEGGRDVSNGLLQSSSTDEGLFETDEGGCVGEVEELLSHGRISTDVVGLDPIGDLERSDVRRDVVELYSVHDEF